MLKMDDKAGSVEIVKMTDIYARLASACHKKFISPKHREGDLQKGEAVCIDCRVAKYSRTGLLGVISKLK